jgi:hypothetical protein
MNHYRTETDDNQQTIEQTAPDLQSNNITFDLLLEVRDNEGDRPPLFSEILRHTDFVVKNACAEVARTVAKSAEDLKGETIGMQELAFDEQAKQLIPWLSPFTDVVIEMSGGPRLTNRFDERGKIVGQSVVDIDENICDVKVVSKSREDLKRFGLDDNAIGTPIPDLLIMNIVLDAVHFQEGSLYSWIHGHIKILTLAASLLGPGVSIAVSPTAVKVLEHEITSANLHYRIEQVIDTSPFVKYRNFRFSEDELRRTGEKAFNYEERGISQDERRRRIALVQLALRIDLGTSLVIDGEIGPDTILHLQQFGTKYNYPPKVSNPFFAAKLLGALVPKPLF